MLARLSTRSFFVVCLITASLTFGVGLVAGATNSFNTKMGQNLADSDISVGHIDLSANVHTAIHDTVSNNMNPTNMTGVNYHSSGRDLDVYDANYNVSWYGKWECHDWFVEDIGGAPVICQKAHVHIELALAGSPNPPGSSYSVTEAESLMCEEVGHGTLKHRYVNGTCMSQEWDEIRWDSHDRGHINNVYD